MACEGQETISIGNYLLERLSQIGVQAGPYHPHSLLDSFSIDLQSLFGVPGDFNLGESFTCLILSKLS
jgi:TPP-dependent 2-oxoacid decarboxylase